jgi:hypothetical protein
MVFACVFVLCIDIGEAGLDRIELVAADAAKEDLAAALTGAEGPSTVLVAQNWNREGIVVMTLVCFELAAHGRRFVPDKSRIFWIKKWY